MNVDVARLQANVDRTQQSGYVVREMRPQDAGDIARVHVQVWRQAYVGSLVGRRAASLWVLRDNVRARTFYSRYGFQPDGATKVHEPTSLVEDRLVREFVTT